MYLPALPAIASDLQASTAATQMTLMVFFVAFGVCQIVYGPVSDMVGRKPPLYLGIVVFALGSVLAALGGALGAEVMAIEPEYALKHLVYFLIVVAVGGLGSVKGPFLAALLLGIGDSACKILAPEFGGIFVYVALFILLLIRPNGLFGRI